MTDQKLHLPGHVEAARAARTPVVPRWLAVVCAGATAVCTVVFVATQPTLPQDSSELLATIARSPSSAATSMFAFALSQLFVIGVVLAIGDLARDGARRVVGTGMVLAVVGAFGHAVFSGTRLSYLGMLTEQGRPENAAAIDRLADSPVMIFAVAGLLGTVLGLLLLGVGLWRSRSVARWIPAALWLFLLLEFVGSAFTSWGSIAAVTAYCAGLAGLAVAVVRRTHGS